MRSHGRRHAAERGLRVPAHEGTPRGGGALLGGRLHFGRYVPQTSRDPGTGPGYEYPQAYVERSLAPGVGEENYKWEDFHEAQSLPELEAQIVALQTALAKIQRTPLGMVEIWAGSRIPDGYALCEGQQLKQSEYPELYKAIGSTYNNAYDCNGRKLSTTSGYFRLPTCAAASWWATTSAMPTTAATARWAARRNTRSPSMRCLARTRGESLDRR